MARVSAVKTLEAISQADAARGGFKPSQSPGLVIQIVSDAPPKVIGPKVIEHSDAADD
jgi:hypothetical protein